jgi:hypothetical protein
VAGRPEDWSGLVGAFVLDAAAQPRRLALGESARLEVTLRGDANLWDARDPLPAGLEGVEVFPQRPKLELEPGVQLSVRRRFVYDLVPRREGRIVIPALRVTRFDPVERRYASETSPALELEVGPRAAAKPASSSEPGARVRFRFEMEPPWLGWLLLGVLASAAPALWWWRTRRRRSLVQPPASAAAPGDEAAALSRALRLALEPRLPRARSAPVEELRAPAGAPPAVERALSLLAAVERARFDPSASAPRRDDVIAAIEALARG